MIATLRPPVWSRRRDKQLDIAVSTTVLDLRSVALTDWNFQTEIITWDNLSPYLS